MKSAGAAGATAQVLPKAVGLATKTVKYRRGEVIFSQGDASLSVMYIQAGGVRLSARSTVGREAVVAMLGPGDLFGEACLAGQSVRTGIATAVTPSTLLVLGKRTMACLLRTRPAVTEWFIAHLIGANIRIHEDLTNHLFNHDETRLARTLLRLARYGTQGRPQHVLPPVSRATLARTVGTTPAKIGLLMKRFKRLGFIDAGDGLRIHRSLLSVVLHE